jgi:DoxX-like family
MNTATPASRAPAAALPAPVSRGSLWTGRILTGLLAAFLLFDVAMKLAPPAAIREQSTQMGFPPAKLTGVGIALLVSLVVYLVPRTSVLGAILLTGYLGGAVAVNVQTGAGPGLILFPTVFGVLAWGGLWLREPRLQAMIPLRQAGEPGSGGPSVGR